MKLKNKINLLVTCDSGAGAGKTTASKYLSKRKRRKYFSRNKPTKTNRSATPEK